MWRPRDSVGLRTWLVRQSLSDRRSGSLASGLRFRRWKLICSLFRLAGTESVIDVGGTDRSWWFVDWQGLVVRCNLDITETRAGVRVKADGCALPFPDRAFDIAFSNSVIEHLDTVES
ncbi:MAG: hypothetical protein DMD54_17690, partial [Gemmatimonadetes bacterium]